jgi:TonB family protein
MQPTLAWNNILAYSLQLGMLVTLAALAPPLMRLRAARGRLLYWQLVLAACLLLPLLRPWRQQVIAGDVNVSTGVARVVPALPAHQPIPWSTLGLALLTAGTLGRLAWLGVGFRRLRRYRRDGRPLAYARGSERGCGSDVTTGCEVLVSNEVNSPVTFGLRRPVILLPERFPNLSAAMQQAILCHETLHVERRDWLFTLAEELIRAVFWFHPAIWWLLGEIQLAREQAVDQCVVGKTGARDPYLDALLTVAGAGFEPDLAPAPLFLRRRHLKHRVLGILKERNMSKRALVSAMAASVALLAAACWFVTGAIPLAAAPQMVADAPGVSVNLNGAPLMHRAAVAYPASAISSGIQGTVLVQVKLDANGEVTDASVLSGPDELRKPVMQSVLTWHFSKEVASTTRTINVDFTLPEKPQATAAVPARMPVMAAPVSQPRTLKGIDVLGLSPEARDQLLAKLPVAAGDQVDAVKVSQIAAAARAFDSHLVIAAVPAGEGAVTLQISPATSSSSPATTPQKIRVGGNVQAMNLITQQRPVYPPEAKAGRIQGKVQLQATIGPDGHIQDLQVMDGEPVLATAALDAVKNWVYKPTLLNGQPVTVVTVIDVNFTLAQ